MRVLVFVLVPATVAARTPGLGAPLGPVLRLLRLTPGLLGLLGLRMGLLLLRMGLLLGILLFPPPSLPSLPLGLLRLSAGLLLLCVRLLGGLAARLLLGGLLLAPSNLPGPLGLRTLLLSPPCLVRLGARLPPSVRLPFDLPAGLLFDALLILAAGLLGLLSGLLGLDPRLPLLCVGQPPRLKLGLRLALGLLGLGADLVLLRLPDRLGLGLTPGLELLGAAGIVERRGRRVTAGPAAVRGDEVSARTLVLRAWGEPAARECDGRVARRLHPAAARFRVEVVAVFGLVGVVVGAPFVVSRLLLRPARALGGQFGRPCGPVGPRHRPVVAPRLGGGEEQGRPRQQLPGRLGVRGVGVVGQEVAVRPVDRGQFAARIAVPAFRILHEERQVRPGLEIVVAVAAVRQAFDHARRAVVAAPGVGAWP